MVDHDPGKLQVYAVEARDSQSVTCIVRCVGGVVRAGEEFRIEPVSDRPRGGEPRATVDWIDRYGHRVEFLDSPHNAKIRLVGDNVPLLDRGFAIISVEHSVQSERSAW